MRNRKTEETGGQKVKKRTSQKEERQQQRRAPNRKSSPPPLAGSSVYPPRRPPATDRRRRHVLRARRARAPLQHPQLVQGHPPPRLRPRAIPFLHPRPLVWHTLPIRGISLICSGALTPLTPPNSLAATGPSATPTSSSTSTSSRTATARCSSTRPCSRPTSSKVCFRSCPLFISAFFFSAAWISSGSVLALHQTPVY